VTARSPVITTAGALETRRAVPEWIGKTPDSKVPDHVRQRVFLRCEGRCHISNRKIMPGEPWDLDHVTALRDGGQHREGNLAPALKEKHRAKTAAEASERAHVDRLHASHFGTRLKKRTALSKHPTLVRGMDGKVRERRS